MTMFDQLSLIIVWIIITTGIGFIADKLIDDGINASEGFSLLFVIGLCTEIVLAVLIFILYCFYNVGMMAWNWII